MSSHHPPIRLDGRPLKIEEVAAVARGTAEVTLTSEARDRMLAARAVIDDIAAGEQAVYGVNTGFGSLSKMKIPLDQLTELQTNIVRSHAAGVGDPLSTDLVRGMMILLAASLARGHSGVRPILVERLLILLEAGITPIVPSRGSVGASGDLAPLAHLALVLLGEGEVQRDGRRMPTATALAEIGLQGLQLQAKEGLALLNGTHLMATCGALAIFDLERIIQAATVAAAMSLDGCRGSHGPLDPRIHNVRGQPGQIAVAATLRTMLEGSTIVEAHRENDPRVQDPYSLRAIPQVLGAAVDAIAGVRRTIEFELGGVTDNPLVFVADDGASAEVLSGGNFHGMPLAIGLDILRVAACHIGGISERRVYWVLSGHDVHNPVTPYLAEDPGLQSGLMIAQYTAAACVSEMQTIANPASVANIPTSAGIEDYNSMGATAGLLTMHSIGLLRNVISIELLTMSQALEHQRPLVSGTAVEAAHATIRAIVPPLAGDRSPAPDIRAVADLIAAGDVG